MKQAKTSETSETSETSIMKNDIYPDLKRLFAETDGRGRKLSYTPQQVVEEFRQYVESLAANPIEVETEYQRQTQTIGESTSRQGQMRKQRFSRPPKVTDFVVRWLGKSMQWWSDISNSKRLGKQFSDIKNKITQYCYDCKLDGAIVGIYNANIIARDLGLHDKIAVEKKETDPIDGMTLEEVNAELKRLGMKTAEQGDETD